ncbi:MAG: septal ring lytic transglycosylase RlpA family protein [Alphaproteobacteria bacterium]|nr:septal ring lytic transglycosylase RlpA family protein [Alphaproteobacteria bacterium]
MCVGAPAAASPETQVAAAPPSIRAEHRHLPTAKPKPDPARPCGAAPYRQSGRAHFYGARHDGRRTASGERFDMDEMTAAHRSLPFGTRVKVTNVVNGRSVVVRINDRHAPGRAKAIDLSRGAAERLGFHRQGATTVRIAAVCGK